MFTFSQQHAWQGNQGVQQILVFPNAFVADLFEREMQDRRSKPQLGSAVTLLVDADSVSDSNAGAIYKLRSVKDSMDKYISVIRCGITGYELYEGSERFSTAVKALLHCVGKLSDTIHQSAALQTTTMID